MAQKEAKIWEYGDFQTPRDLAVVAVSSLREHLSFRPRTIIEPTCGVGEFLLAAADAFPDAEKIIGMDIEAVYLDSLGREVAKRSYADKIELIHGDFFKADWSSLLSDAPKPILVIGNPPWVTSADIGALRGKNLPQKTNFQNHRGFDAVTGKSNFDISEWMLIQHLEWLREHSGAIAMLCKTAVARKVLRYAWKNGIPTVSTRMVQIDAMEHFAAAVDACFFIVESNHEQTSTDCAYYQSFHDAQPRQIFGCHEGMMLSDVPGFYEHHDVIGSDPNYTWRSGIKHDCSKVMELRIDGNRLANANGGSVDIEDTFVYPLLKSSDLANGRIKEPRFKVLVTQRKIGDDTSVIRVYAPETWNYLVANGDLLDKRGSIIYKNKPRFSVFGVGEYSFANWKVAISGFYKRLQFEVIGPIGNKPTMLDDTGYFLSCECQEEAMFLSDLLNSEAARSALSSMIFWSDKRPITIDLLKRLNIEKLAERLGKGDKYQLFVSRREHQTPAKRGRKPKANLTHDLFEQRPRTDAKGLL